MIYLATLTSLLLSMAAAGHPEHLKEKEATIWYLGHSGWAIETQSRFLIFDYWEETEPTEPRALANGHIDPQEIKDKNVVVFVSHSHRDHFDPRILEWKGTIPDVEYIFGWKAEQGPDTIECNFEREQMDFDGLKVRTIVHDADGIPESAFLVELDGLIIFHSGDHGNGPAPFKDHFVDNLDYLAKIAPLIDMIFIPTWGEEAFVIEKLEPKYTFPMHDIHREHNYAKFAERAKKEKLPTKVVAAEKQGDHFFYSNGKMKYSSRKVTAFESPLPVRARATSPAIPPRVIRPGP